MNRCLRRVGFGGPGYVCARVVESCHGLSFAQPAGERLVLRAFLAVLLLAWASSSQAQSDDLIRREIDRALERSLWERGPFYLTPSVRLGGGYDSNAILTGDSRNPDVEVSVAPGLQAVVPFRNRALVEVYEELDFVYYRDLTALRDIANVTRLGGTFGGKSLVMRVENEFRAGKVRPSREFDIPVEQRANTLSTSLSYSLGIRHELSFGYQRYRVRVRDSDLILRDVPLKSLLDRVVDTYSLKFTRHVSTETAVFWEGFYRVQDYDDKSVERDAKGYGGAVGFDFSPNGNVRGEARIGIERIVPDVSTQPDFGGLVGTADVKVGLGQRFAVEGTFYREPRPSVLGRYLYVVENRYGAFLDFYIGRRFFVRPGVMLGTNDYPGEGVPSPEEPVSDVLIRRYNVYSMSFNYKLSPTWLFSVGSSYSTRELSSPSSVEERFIFSLGLRTSF